MVTLKDLIIPDRTDEEKKRFVDDVNETMRTNREKQEEQSRRDFQQMQEIQAHYQRNHKEMLVDAQVEAMRIIAAEKQVTTQQQAVSATKKVVKKLMPEKRLDALKEWLISLGYTLDDELIILPAHYTLIYVYTELGRAYPRLFQHITPESFDSHFWGKQKIVELMRGNKSGIL